MKRALSLAIPLVLAACGGTGTLDLKLTNGATSAATAALVASPPPPVQPTPPALSDASVLSITLPVIEVDVHLGGGADASDADGAWRKVDLVDANGKPVKMVDLVISRGSPTDLGSIDLPAGKITQIRLQLQTSSGKIGEPGFEVIPGAVTIAATGGSESPTTCDLVVPHSAVKPGVKIEGAFDAIQVQEGKTVTATLDFKLNEVPAAASGTSPCLYRLAPVLRIAKVTTN